MKRLGLRTLERVESAEEKNLVGAEIMLLEKNISQQNVQKTVQLTYGGGS